MVPLEILILKNTEIFWYTFEVKSVTETEYFSVSALLESCYYRVCYEWCVIVQNDMSEGQKIANLILSNAATIDWA